MGKLGRRLVLAEGRYCVLRYARQMLAMNDDLLSGVLQRPISKCLRVAASQEFGEEILPSVVKHLATTYPAVCFEVEVEGGLRGLSALAKKDVDAVLTIGLQDHPAAHTLQRVKTRLDRGPRVGEHIERPIPLVVFNQPCRFKQGAMDALDHAGIPWEIEFRSPSLQACGRQPERIWG